MARFLWACWDGGGNLPPSLGIARALTARGHSVLFAGRDEMAPRVRAAGVEAIVLAKARAQRERFAALPLASIFGYLAAPAVGDEVVALARCERPDVVVVDAMFSAALAVAQRFGAPTAVNVNTFFHRVFADWERNLRRQSEGRVSRGFDALPAIDELWGARELIQVNALATLDGPPAIAWPNVRHGAPVLDYEEAGDRDGDEGPAGDRRSLVLVSFSTVCEQRSPAMLQRALDALAPFDVRVVATTGGIVEPGEIAAPPNARVVRFAPHSSLMERASLVVTHAGHGTAMRSLRYGVPMVCIPALAEDQACIAAAVAAWGAGVALRRDAPTHEIREAATTVRADATYRAGAARLAKLFAGVDGAPLAADALESLVAPAASGGRLRACGGARDCGGATT